MTAVEDEGVERLEEVGRVGEVPGASDTIRGVETVCR